MTKKTKRYCSDCWRIHDDYKWHAVFPITSQAHNEDPTVIKQADGFVWVVGGGLSISENKEACKVVTGELNLQPSQMFVCHAGYQVRQFLSWCPLR